MSAPRFSIVVPIYREQENIAGCLESLEKLRRREEAEVVLVDGDGGSTLESVPGGTRPYRLRTLVSPPGRGRQMNAGAAVAAGGILLFLHVDTLLPRNALELAEAALHTAAAGAFSVDHPSGRLFKWWVGVLNLFKRLFRTPYGDQVFFTRAETFREVGGFEEIPIMEDVSFMRRLHRRRLRVRILRTRVLTSSRRWRTTGYAFNFLRNLALLCLYFLGVSPRLLEALYRPSPGSVAGRSGPVAGRSGFVAGRSGPVAGRSGPAPRSRRA